LWGYISTVEGQRALRWPYLFFIGLTSIALLTHTFERMGLAARMDILGSRLTKQLEDHIRLPTAYLEAISDH